MSLNLPVRGNAKLQQLLDRINASQTIQAYWEASNITAIGRLRINDHGPVHIKMPRSSSFSPRVFTTSGTPSIAATTRSSPSCSPRR
jgi:metal-dependent HD superfamily phosphatase/phosphodiesterase